MQKKLDIPYYSQHTDVKGDYWQKRACGALCLKSVLNFYEKENLSPDDFLKLANKKGAYGESGWIHQGLIDVAKDFNIELKRKEFKQEGQLEKGIEEIKKSLEKGNPVFVSAIKRFKEQDKFHMIVLTGFEAENGILKGLYYNDSDYNNEEEGKDLFVDIETFKTYWRRLAIFIE